MNTEFLKKELFILTTMGAFQHNKIYKNNISQEKRKFFRNNIKLLLGKLEVIYCSTVNEEDHLTNLDKFKKDIENKNGYMLNNSMISFGTTQKILNLYLKYLWSVGLISEPPHCPIDKIILNKINDKKTSWTKMSKNDYCKSIEEIKRIKGKLSIAKWELENFDRDKIVR